MDAASLYHWGVVGMGIAAVFVFPSLFFITAPYGRHARAGWGPTMPARAGWIAMELPAPIGFAWVYSLGPHAGEIVPMMFLALFELHYLQRTLVFPLLMRSSGKRNPIAAVLMAAVFNVVNASLNALAVSHVRMYEPSWLADPRFIVGCLLFVTGFAVNLHSDAILRALRKPGEVGYKIPRGGAHRWVSSPNYLGEIVEWVGWALATWSAAGLAFAVFTIANLAPRAVSNHRWYHEKFADYPSERRALVPGLW